MGGGDAKKDLLSAVGAPSLHDLSRQLYGLYCGIERPRQVSVDLHILRFTGMRRESVATLRVRNLYPEWGLRGVLMKGGKTRDIPLPAVVSQYVHQYVENTIAQEHGPLAARGESR